MLSELLHEKIGTGAPGGGMAEGHGAQRSAASSLLLEIVRRLDDARVPYCILHGHECMPAIWHSDIDLCIARSTLRSVLAILDASAERTGWSVCNLLPHEQSALGVVLARQTAGGTVDVVILDLCTDYQYNGLLYLDADTLLAGRTVRRGLTVAAPATELAYLLAKRTLKRSLAQEHVAHLADLYRNDPLGAERLLKRLWSHPIASELISQLHAASPAMTANVEVLRRDLRRRALTRTVRTTPQALFRELLRVSLRAIRPIGTVIAVLGPDGAGKTTVISAVETQLAPLFRRSARLHLRPRLVGPQVDGGALVPDPHSRPNRSLLASVSKLGLYAGVHRLAHLLRIRPQLVRGCLVLYDRYFDDISVDPRRYRYGGPLWLVSRLRTLVPRPDFLIVLDAPVDVLRGRKQEVPAEEAERQRSRYRLLAAATPNSVVIDASRPVEQIVTDVNRFLLDGLRRRAQGRMRRIGERRWTIAG